MGMVCVRLGATYAGVPPTPPNSGLPEFGIIVRKSGRPDLRRGRVGEGGRREFGAHSLPPPLTPPRKGEGREASARQLSSLITLFILITPS